MGIVAFSKVPASVQLGETVITFHEGLGGFYSCRLGEEQQKTLMKTGRFELLPCGDDITGIELLRVRRAQRNIQDIPCVTEYDRPPYNQRKK